jgi:hypothetical protein
MVHPSVLDFEHSPRSIGVGISLSTLGPMRIGFPHHVSNTMVKELETA